MNYHYMLSNNPEERGSHPLRGGSLRSRELMNLAMWERSHSIITVPGAENQKPRRVNVTLRFAV